MNRLKKVLFGLAVMLTMGLFSSGTVLAAQIVPVESVRTNYVGGVCRVALGQSEEVRAVLTPYNATNQAVTWRIDNPSIATVEANGLAARVRGVSEGNANLTVTTADGGKTATCVINVKRYARLSSLTLNRTSITIGLNDQPVLLKESYVKAEEGPVGFKWDFSSKSGVIRFEPATEGLYVVPQKAGTETVVITDYAKSATATCTVTVVGGSSGTKDVRVKTLKLNQTKATMSLGESLQLTPIITPSDATNQGVVWTSSNPAAFTVDAMGVVKCIGPGNAKITATTVDGSKKKAICTITGPKQASSVKITGPKTIDYQGTAQLSAEVKPFNAVDKSVTWTVDKGMGTVDENGLVTCDGPGDIKVRATTSNGKKSTYTLKGPKAASSVKITGEKTVEFQKSVVLTATVKPDNAPDKRVEWTLVKGNGEIHDNGDGTCTVTCTGPGDIKVQARTIATNKKATFTVKGPKAASSVKITGEKTVEFQKSVTLTATVKPENAPDKRVEWTLVKGNGKVQDNGDSTCTVTCDGPGDIKVQARTIATNKKATFTVKGPKAATSVSVKKSSYKLAVGESVQPIATVNPKGVIDPNVTWSSSDPAIATVTPEGVITAIAPGKTTILATAHNGKVGKCTVTVQ